MKGRIIVAVTGASGSPIAIKLIDTLLEKGYRIGLIASENGNRVMRFETGHGIEHYSDTEGITIYDNNDLGADISSGTTRFEAMIIVPCSTSTLAKINCGVADNLITRGAAVAIKEKIKLILVPRESPLSPIVLRNMKELADIGVEIIPPMMEFYTKPETIDDLISFTAGRILDSLEIEHRLYRRWNEKE